MAGPLFCRGGAVVWRGGGMAAGADALGGPWATLRVGGARGRASAAFLDFLLINLYYERVNRIFSRKVL